MNKLLVGIIFIASVILLIVINNLLIIKHEYTPTDPQGGNLPQVSDINILQEVRFYQERVEAYMYHRHYKWQQTQVEEDDQSIDVGDKVMKIEEYLTINYPSSPIIGNVQMMVNQVGQDKTIKALSIMGQESSFGLSGYVATNCNNYAGYLYYGTGTRGCGSPRWDTPANGISRYLELEEDGWLASENMDGYCVTGCGDWYTGVAYFENILINL